MTSNGIDLCIPGASIRIFYTALISGAALLIVSTALSDLQSPLVDNFLGRQLDLKLEGNLAVWYSSAVLLLASAAAFLVRRRTAGRLDRYLWTIAALFFAAISADETAQLHETAGVLFTSRFGRVPYLTEGSLPVFAWLLVLLPLIAIFFTCILTAVRCWRGVYQRSRKLILGGICCWAGVLLAEFVQAQLRRWSMDRSIQGVIEEGLEITGSTLFVAAFVEYLRAEKSTGTHATEIPGRG